MATKLTKIGSFECIVHKPTSGWIGGVEADETPFVCIPVEVASGPNKGEYAIWRGYLSEKAADGTTARLARVFGFDGDYASLSVGRNQTIKEGMPCNIETELNVHNGKTTTKVAWLNPSGGGGAKAPEASKVASLMQRLNVGKHKAIAKEANASRVKPSDNLTPNAAPAESAPPADDDVPF